MGKQMLVYCTSTQASTCTVFKVILLLAVSGAAERGERTRDSRGAGEVNLTYKWLS